MKTEMTDRQLVTLVLGGKTQAYSDIVSRHSALVFAKAMGVVTGHLPEAERPMAFVKALVELQKACGVDGLKMSDYGITKEDMAKCAANARHTMGGLFELDPYALSLDETTQIMMNAYK